MTRRVRAALLAAPAALLLVPVLGLEVARVVGPVHPYRLVLALGLLPLVGTLAAVALLLAAGALVLRRSPGTWGVAAVAAATTLAWLVWTVPAFVPDGQPSAAAGTRIRVMTLNVHYAVGNPAAVLAVVRRENPDVLAMDEVSGDFFRRFDAIGGSAEFPHRFIQPSDVGGTGLWSRLPLADTLDVVRLGPDHAPRGVVTVGGRRLVIQAVHVVSPRGGLEVWDTDLAGLARGVRSLAAGPDPFVVLGDLNSTSDHRQLRAVLRAGARDAAAVAGYGMVRTWPADRSWPPLAGIDHVLVGAGVVVTGFHVVGVPTSDHRAVVADLALAAA